MRTPAILTVPRRVRSLQRGSYFKCRGNPFGDLLLRQTLPWRQRRGKTIHYRQRKFLGYALPDIFYGESFLVHAIIVGGEKRVTLRSLEEQRSGKHDPQG